ncbi:hypothetical protein [Fodinicola acaciae]|nr:hypothetical protein [Fodinicola acaciae]
MLASDEQRTAGHAGAHEKDEHERAGCDADRRSGTESPAARLVAQARTS